MSFWKWSRTAANNATADGSINAFTAHAGNGGACTLNVDGLGAKPLRSAPSTELLAGMLVAGTPYAATYYNVSGEWILRGLTGAPGIPLGVALPYFGVTAPASAFALPFGQAISRTTYVNLFNLIATTYGAGDGATTFNLPDLRGYLLAGKDDMGGRSRAYEVMAFLDGMARTTTDETTPALVARGAFAMNPIAVRIHIRSPCPT